MNALKYPEAPSVPGRWDFRTGDLPYADALYGAGQLGRAMLRKLRAAGVEPVAFADDTPEKQGQVIDGLPVMASKTAAEKFGAQLVFVVTILNPLLNFVTARRRLAELTGARVLSL